MKFLSVSITCVLSGNTSVSNFTTSSSFRIQQSFGHDCSSQSSQVFELVLPTSSSPGFRPVARLQLHYPSQLAPCCPPPLAGTLLPFPPLACTLMLPTSSERSTFGHHLKTHLDSVRPLGSRWCCLALPLETPLWCPLRPPSSTCLRAPLRSLAPLRQADLYILFLSFGWSASIIRSTFPLSGVHTFFYSYSFGRRYR